MYKLQALGNCTVAPDKSMLSQDTAITLHMGGLFFDTPFKRLRYARLEQKLVIIIFSSCKPQTSKTKFCLFICSKDSAVVCISSIAALKAQDYWYEIS